MTLHYFLGMGFEPDTKSLMVLVDWGLQFTVLSMDFVQSYIENAVNKAIAKVGKRSPGCLVFSVYRER